MAIKPGLTFSCETVVDTNNCASALGSGNLMVFATPAMVALMEKAALSAVAPYLPEGSTTVGTSLNINHVRATPIGKKVTATATLTSITGLKLAFTVSAHVDANLIGEGTHERFIVECGRFMKKL